MSLPTSGEPVFASEPEFIERPTEEDYARAAHMALSTGRFALAFEQVAAALAHDPRKPEWLSMLDEITKRAGEPLQYLGVSGRPFFGVVAVRARVLERRNRLAEALDLLFQVVTFRPNIPYLAWCENWSLERRRVRKLSWTHLEPRLSGFAERVSRIPELDGATRINAEWAAHTAGALQHASG